MQVKTALNVTASFVEFDALALEVSGEAQFSGAERAATGAQQRRSLSAWTDYTASRRVLRAVLFDTRVVASTQSFKYQYLSLKYHYQYPCLK